LEEEEIPTLLEVIIMAIPELGAFGNNGLYVLRNTWNPKNLNQPMITWP
jgi:hypothetical protein